MRVLPTPLKLYLLLIIQILIQGLVSGAVADYLGALAIDDVHLPIVVLESGSRFRFRGVLRVSWL